MITAEIKQDGETVCKITACKTDVKVSRSFAYKYKYKDINYNLVVGGNLLKVEGEQ